MATDKDKIFDSLAIRNTATHDSDLSDAGEFTAETIVIHNGLNQQVALQLQGSCDGSVWINIGNGFNINPTTNDYQTVTDYFCHYRLQASCGTSPTTGVLDAWILKTQGS